jgi:hypothetical protein
MFWMQQQMNIPTHLAQPMPVLFLGLFAGF